jgi:oxaloacetate decarboxylase alpha subunit
VLTVALFPQVGLKFLENRHNPAAFEPVPQAEEANLLLQRKPPPPASTPWKWKAKPLW